MLTTGDNIYARVRVLGVAIGGTGDEDDDWFFTYFQPYRYVINRIPVYPSIGNHDADETEERDDRAQVEDNFYLRERIGSEEAAGRASFGPGLVLPVPLRLGHRVRLHRHVEGERSSGATGCSSFRNTGNSSSSRFPPKARIRPGAFRSRIIRSTAPVRSITTRVRWQKLLPLFERSGVRVMFTGHEHNFQHSRANGLDHFVTGAAGKVARDRRPDGFLAAHTVSWATDCHFLLARIEGRRMVVRAIAAMDEPAGTPVDIERFDAGGRPVSGPVEITV